MVKILNRRWVYDNESYETVYGFCVLFDLYYENPEVVYKSKLDCWLYVYLVYRHSIAA